jgi:arylsulfatase A-like enzyme
MMRFIPLLLFATVALAADKPNILWLTIEDSSPHLGCYGDTMAKTPSIDAFATKGLRFQRAWSNAPVCAPARTCIVTGRWAPSDGAEHMRSGVPLPSGHRLLPELMRDAGYYCTNNAKEDYNLSQVKDVWDESSKSAHWKKRPDGKPFFAVFNFETTHESKIRATPHTQVRDPDTVKPPRYHPNVPEVRKDWAQHFDNLTTVDQQIAAKLQEIDAAGLAEDTIIFFYSDHGTGMPRSKRCPLDSGLRVPFIVHFPAKWAALAPQDYVAGGVSPQLIQFIDLAPTALSIAGVQPPGYMHGLAFAGKHRSATAHKHLYGFRGRMDDLIRSITDGRFVYVKHFMPQLPWGQRVAYMFQQASTVKWHELATTGDTLNEYQTYFWGPKDSEEIFDLQTDPTETENLAINPEFFPQLASLRHKLKQWLTDKRDLGLVPESERAAISKGQSPKDALADGAVLPYTRVLDAAWLATDRTYPEGKRAALPALTDASAMVRYWGVQGVLMRGREAFDESSSQLRPLLKDSSAAVRIATAEAFAKYSDKAEDVAPSLDVLMGSAVASAGSAAAATEALNAIDRLGEKAAPKKDALATLSLVPLADEPQRNREYPRRLVEALSNTLGFPAPAGEGKKSKRAK